MNRLSSLLRLLIVFSILLAGCQTSTAAPERALLYLDASTPVEQRVEDLLARMTLDEKIGQLAQVEKNSVRPEDITRLGIGSILSGGGGSPEENTPAAWAQMVDGFQSRALKTRLRIPLIYGADAVHGHNNLRGATIFPHNIGLGAANDPALAEKVGRATAEELAATGIRWNFAPVLAVPQDIRWGRTYEGYSSETSIVSALGTAYLRGLQGSGALSDRTAVLAMPKHYIGDGGTEWGTSPTQNYQLDQGDVQMDEAALREKFLPPYQAAIEAGAMSVMVSFSSWNGTKMHAEKHLLTDVLKGELGFQGFIVSDYQAIDQISPDYSTAVVTSINAGLDMIMIPTDYNRFLTTLKAAVQAGKIPQSRIDDAVRRILRVKFMLGLFEHSTSDPALLSSVGSAGHGALARQAVAKSLVLLKNEGGLLPLPAASQGTGSTIFVGGSMADDIGVQCGGWTIEWQGKRGAITPGTTILQAIQAEVGKGVKYDASGRFSGETADVGVAVVGEEPYAEGVGDRADLSLSAADEELIRAMRERSKKLVVVILSGRPLVIADLLPLADAWVAAWLPGSEGQGVTDGLFGRTPFTGRTPYAWPMTNDDLPRGEALFPVGYGQEK